MTWVIYDLMILLFLGVCVLVYAKKGLMASLMGLAAFVLSMVIAYFLSTPAATLVYNWFVRDGLHARIESGETGFFYNIVSISMFGNASGGNAALDSAAISVLRIVTFIVLVLVLYLVLKVVEKLFQKANDVPLVGTVNKVLGGLLGGVLGILLCLIFVGLSSLLIAASGDTLTWLNSRIVEETVLFKLFYRFDLLRMLFG